MAVEEVSGYWRGNKNDLLHCRAVKVLEQESADPALAFPLTGAGMVGKPLHALGLSFQLGQVGK